MRKSCSYLVDMLCSISDSLSGSLSLFGRPSTGLIKVWGTLATKPEDPRHKMLRKGTHSEVYVLIVSGIIQQIAKRVK